jgi:transposase
MGQRFVSGDRDQALLLPPDVREWLPDDHLALFVIDAVDEMDLSSFYGRYRRDGWGRPAYDPAVMVALVLYAYAVGVRSARAIERRCVEDVAFRVVAANLAPDHATLARFRAEHEDALGELFSQVLGLCQRAGLVRAGVIAVDSTKVAANASGLANMDFERLAREVLEEAAAVDAAEDALYGDKRGDELPPELVDRSTRKRRLRELLEEVKAERAAEADVRHAMLRGAPSMSVGPVGGRVGARRSSSPRRHGRGWSTSPTRTPGRSERRAGSFRATTPRRSPPTDR